MVQFKLKFKGLPEGLQPGAFQLAVVQESIRATNEALVETKNKMVQVSPFGGTALLRQSWQIEPARRSGRLVIGRVTAAGSVAANVLEDGAEPHHPPVGEVGTTPALGVWIRRKLGITSPEAIRQVAFAISQNMSIRGIERRRIFSKAFLSIAIVIRARMNQILTRIQARFQTVG